MVFDILKAAEGIDPEVKAHFKFISTVKNTAGPHTHDFYELFLITKGKTVHCINGRKQVLEENSIVFIRDRDVHYFECCGVDFQFINLSFYKEVVDEIFKFLGEGFPMEDMLTPELPPAIILSSYERNYFQYRLERIDWIPPYKKSLIRAEVLALLVELFSRYIMEPKSTYTNDQLDWIHWLCTKMKEGDHFIEGIPALLRLSGKTHSHLCRVFKKYLNLTPVEYVNRLRLSYAENLLLNTDKEIIDISMDVGFQNISYFYKVFKKNYRMTPYQFRKKERFL